MFRNTPHSGIASMTCNYPFSRLRKLLMALMAAASPAVAPCADAQTYPSKPITLHIAYASGGIIDTVLRMINPRVSANLGQPVVLLNRPGGGGTIATDAVIAAGNDGYNLLVNGDQMVTSPHLMGKLVRHDIFRDLAPITRFFTVPFALIVNPAVSANTLAEFIALAKSGKAMLTYSTPGNGTGNHLAMEYFKAITGADLLHVPYKGALAAVTDVAAGRIDAIMFAPQTVVGSVKAGKLRALAVSGASRTVALSEVPTFAEAGMPGFDVGTTFGLLAVAGTPEPIIARLHAEFAGAMREPELRRKIEDAGTVVSADTPAEFAKKLKADYERNGRIIRENRIQSE
jgi:tripartite-type tricarboxylate transporter receptor subunit TctC